MGLYRRVLELRVLVGCEASGRVRDAFRALGHDAFSCDLVPCDTGAQWHIQADVQARQGTTEPRGRRERKAHRGTTEPRGRNMTAPNDRISFAQVCRDAATGLRAFADDTWDDGLLRTVTALHVLGALVEEAGVVCDVSDAEAGPEGVWSTDSLLTAMSLVRRLATRNAPEAA